MKFKRREHYDNFYNNIKSMKNIEGSGFYFLVKHTTNDNWRYISSFCVDEIKGGLRLGNAGRRIKSKTTITLADLLTLTINKFNELLLRLREEIELKEIEINQQRIAQRIELATKAEQRTKERLNNTIYPSRYITSYDDLDCLAYATAALCANTMRRG